MTECEKVRIGWRDMNREQVENILRLNKHHADHHIEPIEIGLLLKLARSWLAMHDELEQLRTQLAGCGVAAGQNTPATVAHRAKPGDYGWSASYGDVCRAVDREMAMHDVVEAARTGDVVAVNRALAKLDEQGES